MISSTTSRASFIGGAETQARQARIISAEVAQAVKSPNHEKSQFLPISGVDNNGEGSESRSLDQRSLVTPVLVRCVYLTQFCVSPEQYPGKTIKTNMAPGYFLKKKRTNILQNDRNQDCDKWKRSVAVHRTILPFSKSNKALPGYPIKGYSVRLFDSLYFQVLCKTHRVGIFRHHGSFDSSK